MLLPEHGKYDAEITSKLFFPDLVNRVISVNFLTGSPMLRSDWVTGLTKVILFQLCNVHFNNCHIEGNSINYVELNDLHKDSSIKIYTRS